MIFLCFKWAVSRHIVNATKKTACQVGRCPELRGCGGSPASSEVSEEVTRDRPSQIDLPYDIKRLCSAAWRIQHVDTYLLDHHIAGNVKQMMATMGSYVSGITLPPRFPDTSFGTREAGRWYRKMVRVPNQTKPSSTLPPSCPFPSDGLKRSMAHPVYSKSLRPRLTWI